MKKRIERDGFDEVKVHFFDNQLYFETFHMLKELEGMKTRSSGITTYSKQAQTPDVELGLTEYRIFMGGYTKHLTDKGLELVNAYRETQELKHVK